MIEEGAFYFKYKVPFFYRGIAQSGSAPALGAGCQEFESPYPDQFKSPRIERCGDFFFP